MSPGRDLLERCPRDDEGALMAAEEIESAPSVHPVPVPRSLKHEFSSRVGFPGGDGDIPVPPPLARGLSTWLESGSVLVMSAPRGYHKSIALAAWLRIRPERILWVEGSDLLDRGDAVDAALDGLYELGVLTRIERMACTRLSDATDAILHENTPIVLVVNDVHKIREFPGFPGFAQFAAEWPNARFAFVTDAVVDPSVADTTGITLLGPTDLSDPLGELGELSAREPGARAQVVRDWAQQRDPSGGLFRLILHLAQFLSVRRDSLEIRLVDDLDAAIDELRERRVIELDDTADGQLVSLASEFREALDAGSAAHPDPELTAIHVEAARASALLGDADSTMFHLARAGKHAEALLALEAIPLLAPSAQSGIEATRNAAAAIDIDHTGHTIKALTARLQLAMVPPLEPVQTRDSIQDALKRAQDRATSPLTRELEIDVTIANMTALIARGRYGEARALGRPLAETLLALPWLRRRGFGTARILTWAAQATAEVLEGRIDDASRFALVAQDAALDANMPYALYMATAALAAIEAQRGELVAAERELREAQRIYRRSGWPRSVAQSVEFVARYYLARAALDVDGMIELRLDMSVVLDPSGSMHVLDKICECFVYLHSGQATQTRVAVRQLADLIRDLRPGAVFESLGFEMTVEALLRFGEASAAIEFIETERSRKPHIECLLPLLATAHVALGDGATALSITEECARPGSHHSPADYSLLLLVRAAAHELVGQTEQADESFEEALLTLEPSPMPYLFLMVPNEIRLALWPRVSEERQQYWMELRRFLATVPEGVARSDDSLPRDRLTAREMEILRAISIGGTLEEIAVSQYVSRNTVKTHVRLIYKKLHVNTRAAAAQVMKRFGEQLVES
jgi:DNA-binding CsgD family transcriptional regulator/tetratricopeptide (TPR) repeat protein